ncbi:MAG: IS110 family transposase [Candidatus Brocadiaceae bacterium]|nr:IS110 family transposase [Candidatus Brocadiaceae bacterium]
MSYNVGIDLHSDNNFIGIIDKKDCRILSKKVPNDLDLVLDTLKPFKRKIKGVVVESTYNWYLYSFPLKPPFLYQKVPSKTPKSCLPEPYLLHNIYLTRYDPRCFAYIILDLTSGKQNYNQKCIFQVSTIINRF